MPNAWYHPCSECGTSWHYDGESGTYNVEERKEEIELIPMLQAIGLHVITECPVHPGSDHDPFDCP